MGRVHLSIADAIATIELDNPASHNAVDAPMRDELAAAYARVESDESVRVAIIRGSEGASFCAGGSIDGYLERGVFGPDGAHLPRIPRPHPATKPYIAAMNGYALGGGFALALACDLRIAGRSARMGPTGLKLGAVQGAQTISRLTRLIGASKALEVLLLSKRLTADEAVGMGLVHAVVDDDQVLDTAREWAATIAGFSPWTVAMTKKLVYEAQHLPLEDAMAWEDEVATEAYRRPEALEGFTAFKEGRRAKF
ncbi:MAG TPA: enoyl-CoA hydratase/isomerase family protein [Ramlibacter sp.]|nr:enoyl-CoA hydratase/isomerase family protein [Ramlibacter sp.]